MSCQAFTGGLWVQTAAAKNVDENKISMYEQHEKRSTTRTS